MNLIHPNAPASSRRLTLFVAALALTLFGAMTVAAVNSAPAQAKLSKKAKAAKKKKGLVSTMTRNLYLGADLAPAINATSTDDFIDKNGQILRDVDTNNFPVRAKGLAAEIKGKSPDLVGLQEVALWRTGPVDLNAPLTGNFTASDVHVDYLSELMNRLNKGKKRYRVVKVQNEFDFEAPADYNGVAGARQHPGHQLERRDQRTSDHAGRRPRQGRCRSQGLEDQGRQFRHIYTAKISGVNVNVDRGYISFDAKVRKSPKFRFVNTHLEAFGEPEIRRDQAKELLAGPLKSGKLPAVLVGDLNSDDNTVAGPGPPRLQRPEEGRNGRTRIQRPGHVRSPERNRPGRERQEVRFHPVHRPRNDQQAQPGQEGQGERHGTEAGKRLLELGPRRSFQQAPYPLIALPQGRTKRSSNELRVFALSPTSQF